MRTELRHLKAFIIAAALLPTAATLLPPTSPALAAQDKTDGRGDPAPRQIPRQAWKPKPHRPRPKPPAVSTPPQEPTLPPTDLSHLNRFAVALRGEPNTSEGYIICYAGRKDGTGKVRRRCELAKNYLVQTHGFDATRLQVRDGGYKEDFHVELWVVPQGAQPPPLSPTLTPEQVRQYRLRQRP